MMPLSYLGPAARSNSLDLLLFGELPNLRHGTIAEECSIRRYVIFGMKFDVEHFGRHLEHSTHLHSMLWMTNFPEVY